MTSRHRARETVELLKMETPDFILLGPGCNPADYKVWSVMQEKVYQKRINDIDELRARILTVWNKMDQRITDKAVRQCHTRLRACIKLKVDTLNIHCVSNVFC